LQRFSEKVSFIWSVADILRGDYKQSEYGRVILPFTVLRRLDQVLAPTRQAVLDAADRFKDSPEALRERMLLKASGQGFYNTSKLDFESLLADPTHIATNLVGYINGFSTNARDIVDNFRFEAQIERLDQADILYLVVQKFASVDLHPDRVSNLQMGYVFEELIRKFAEQSNETAGEHFTPREVIRLMVNLLFVEDDDALRKPGIVRTMYDPACGTGGMLSVAEEYLAELNPDARLQVFGQELNPESYAICKSDMLVKGQDSDNIRGPANSFSDDRHPDLRVDYLISNPPFGVDWSKADTVVRAEHEQKGHAGRFGPGLPRKNDGSLLFLLHMLSKMKPTSQGGSRLAIVFNGSPLLHRGSGLGRERDSPPPAGERPARSHRRPARPDVLQHGHQHLRLGCDQPQARPPQGQGAAHQRRRAVPEDAEVPGRQAQGAVRRPHRRADPPVRGLRGGPPLQGLRQRGLRLPPHPGGAAPPARLPGQPRPHRPAPRFGGQG
jgi:type I restriction enzyme M protein